MGFFKFKKDPTLDEVYNNIEKSVKTNDLNIDKYNKELNVIKQKIEEEKKKKPVNQNVIKILRTKAANLIKKKKMYENNKETTLGIQYNMDQVKFTSDNVQMTIDTCKALKNTTKVLKKNMKKVNIGKIEKMQDDIYDCIEEAKEIGEVLSTTYDIPLEIDENEIDAELSLIEDTILEENTECENITNYLEKEKITSEEPQLDEKNDKIVQNEVKQ